MNCDCASFSTVLLLFQDDRIVAQVMKGCMETAKISAFIKIQIKLLA